MADFDLSARITADASDLVQAGAQGEAAYEGLGRGAREAAAGSRELTAAQDELMRATAREAQAIREGARAANDGAQADREATRAKREGEKAANDNARAMARQGFAARNAYQQVGDLGLSISAGISPARAFGQQAGQLGYALSEMGGKAGAVGKFLVGPWGIALTIALAVLAPFVEKLFDAGDAAGDFLDKANKAASAADVFGSAQGILGNAIDLTTGKLKTQNQVLIESIRLQALAGIAKAKQDQIESRKALIKTGDPGFLSRVGDAGSGFLKGGSVGGGGMVGTLLGGVAGAVGGYGENVDPRLNQIATAYANGTIKIKEASAAVRGLGLDATKTNEALLKVVTYGTALESETANQDILNALDGKGLSAGLRRDKKGRVKKAPKPKSTAARDEFGEDSAAKIAALRDQFSDIPERVRAVNKQLADLDDLIDDLARKKPPGFEKMIADAKALKPLVIDSLQKPYRDFVRDQQEGLEVQRLVTAGRVDEAAALRVIQGLQRDMPPLTLKQRDAVLATVQAMRAEQKELEKSRRLAEKYVDAIGGIKDVVMEATQAFVRGDLGQLLKSPGKLLDVFQQFEGRKLFDRLFDGAFQELEDQANGTSVVKDASDRMATAVDKASASIARLGGAADTASARLNGTATPGAANDNTTPGGEVVVTAQRSNPVARAIGKLSEGVAGLFTNPEKAKVLGQSIGKFAGKGLEGAATGSFVAGISKSLGIKMSGTGAQIGGAIGKFLPIPGGDIIGSVLGGLVGGLFKKTKTGSASISNVNGAAGVTGTAGNSSSYKTAATGLAGGVIDGINSIVEALGGELGNFNVSIGQRKKKFVVDSSGSGKTKGSGTQSFGTAEEAAAAALANAIADGAIGGISAAMQQALRNNSDVEKGVREALKVKEVETLIGGLGSALKSQFDAFDRTAADRVRIARQYGLDVVAVEKLNAEERVRLVDDTLKSRIGSLSDFLQSVKFGDLFEGTADQRRSALLDEIAKVQADAEAGKDGAADKLAQLSQQLISTSRDAFGTAGPEYTTDRSNTISGVERVIQMEQDRVNQAAGITQAAVDAINVGNGIAGEQADLLAQVVTGITNLGGLLGGLSLGGGGGGGGGGGYGFANYDSTFRGENLF